MAFSIPIPHPPVFGALRAVDGLRREALCRSRGHAPVRGSEVYTVPLDGQTVRPERGERLVERIETCSRCARQRVATPWLGTVWVKRR